MRIALLVALVVGCLLSTGCAGIPIAPVMPPPGLLISSYTAPLDIDVDKTDIGSKRGEASSYAILGLISMGDAGIDAAARDVGIRTIKHADYKAFNVLGIYSTYTTIVYGD